MHLRGKWGIAKRISLCRWVSNRARSIHAGTRFCSAKSNVLYFCFRLTLFCVMQSPRFTASKPLKFAFTSDEKSIRQPNTSFVRCYLKTPQHKNQHTESAKWIRCANLNKNGKGKKKGLCKRKKIWYSISETDWRVRGELTREHSAGSNRWDVPHNRNAMICL